MALPDAAADVIDDLPELGAHGHFNESRIGDVPRQGKGLGAGAVLRADGAIPLGAFFDDQRHIGKGLHIVQHRRLAKKALLHRPGRLHPGHAPLALDGSGESAALATDESARPTVDADIEIMSRT